MKWLKITVVFFLITLVKSGPTRSEEPNPEPEPEAEPDALSLNKIEKKDDDNLLFTLSAQTKPTSDHLILQVKGAIEKSFQSLSPTGSSQSYTFENVLTQYSGKEVEFEILVNDAKDVPLDSIHIPTFKYPNFPSYSTTIFIEKAVLPDGKLLRVDGNMGDMTIKDGTFVSNIKKDTQYWSFLSSVKSYVPCVDTNGISVCDEPIPEDPVTATEGDLNSAILSYKDDSTATIKLSFDVDPTPITIRDVIINLSDSGKNLLFTVGEECTITETFPSLGTYNILILKSPGDDTWTTNSVDIKDRALEATILGGEIIEGRWNILGDEVTPTYRIRRTINGDVVPDDEIEVDCSHLETYCFGYFPIQIEETDKYTLIVAHQTNAPPPTYDELRQVESKPQTKSSSSEPELAILSRHTKRHANQLMADVNICFEHLTPTEGRSFSHYEMLIINEKGQWLKHRILEEEEEEEEREGRLCFTPFAINTKDFDLTEGTKVIVSQRGVDGFTVLATGQSKLL